MKNLNLFIFISYSITILACAMPKWHENYNPFNADTNVTVNELRQNGYKFNKDLSSYIKLVNDTLTVHYVAENSQVLGVIYSIQVDSASLNFSDYVEAHDGEVVKDFGYDEERRCHLINVRNKRTGIIYKCCWTKKYLGITHFYMR